MKQKLLTALLAGILAFTMTACGGTAKKDTKAAAAPSSTETSAEAEADTSTETSAEAEASTETLTKTPTETTAPAKEAKTDATLESLETFLLDKGVLTGERTEVAELTGVKNGFKYPEVNVEIYEFETIPEIKEGEKIELANMGEVPITASGINGNFLLIFSNDNVNQDVLNAFKSFK